MKIKKTLSLVLAFLTSLNAFAFTPSISFANNNAIEKTTCFDKQDKEKAEDLKKKIDANDELKIKIKLLEKKIKELEKNSKTQEMNLNTNTYDKKVKGFLNILKHLIGTIIAGVSATLLSVFLSAAAGAGATTIGVISLVSCLTVSSFKLWINYLEGYVS